MLSEAEKLSRVFIDTLFLDDAPRKTRDGYLVASPRVARTGIQEYLGSEVGRPDLGRVKVYRPEEEVFSTDALRSFGHLPVTIDHPPVLVDSKNWKKYAAGQTDGDVLRDGEFVRIPMMLMDSLAIGDVEAGKVELSMGYTADLDWTPGTTPEGETYDVMQKNIRGNHLAIVDRARGGSSLRVIDTQPTQTEANMADKTIVVDGISVLVSDTAEQVIKKSFADMDAKEKKIRDQIKSLEDELAAMKKGSETKDAEIATLKSQLADAAMTPEKLDQAVKVRAQVIDSAKAMLDSVVVDGKTESEIRRQVVDSKLGDAAKGWSDDQISASFNTLAASAPASNQSFKKFGDSVVSNQNVATADSAYNDYVQDLSSAWQGGSH